MTAAIVLSGFVLGAVGSLHCVGMCGPLALALPVHHLPKTARFFSLLFYQLGRVATYSFLGLIFGSVGRGLYLAGFQQALSIIMGIVVLTSLVMYYGYRYAFQPAFLSRLFQSIQRFAMRLLQSEKNIASFLLLGVANGFLPCGMVYIAVASALTAPSPVDGALFMAMFGLGTLPAMLALGYFGQMISIRVRLNLRKLVPVFIGIVGVLLILRGLNLGIPYISPALPAVNESAAACHS